MDENPYQPPQVDPASADPASAGNEAKVCSFCGQPPSSVGLLVEAPEERAYICRSCAQTVLSVVDGRRKTGWGGPVVLGLWILAAVGLGWDWLVAEEPQITESFLMMLVAACFGATLLMLVVTRVLTHSRR